MKDYISREDAVMVAGDMLNSLTGISCKEGENTAREYFRSIPSTDIRENIHGKWDSANGYTQCTACKTLWRDYKGFVAKSNYCPYCGAEMQGEGR